jgi:hypothetical protein
LEEHVASIFRVEEWAKQEISMRKETCLPKRLLMFNGLNGVISQKTDSSTSKDDCLRELGIDGRAILNWFLKKHVMKT